MKIWKFAIDWRRSNQTTLSMPAGAQVLDVQAQGDDIVLWALVDPEQEYEERDFLVFTTGGGLEPIDGDSYVGTVQLQGGAFVLHVWEATP